MSANRIKMYLTSYSEEVTGSNNHVKIKWPDGREVSFLIDCGLFQEPVHNHINYDKLKYNPENISFAIATHVHTDHIGRFPYIVRKGFNGKIFTSSETAILLATVLSESAARLDDEYRGNLKKYKEAKVNAIIKKLNAKGRGRRDYQRREFRKCKECEYLVKEKAPFLLYDRDDIDNTIKLVCAYKLNETFSPYPGVEITFYPNAHIAGAVITVCRIFDENEENFILFTGDLGLTNPLTNVKTSVPKEVIDKINILVSESTYGSSEYSKNTVEQREFHKQIIKKCLEKNGTIMYLSNSLERPLILGIDLKKMQNEKDTKKLLSNCNIFFDTTFGINCLKKYKKIYGDEYLPENFSIIDKDSREASLSKQGPKIFICTSPKLKQGSFLNYGSKMLEDPNVTLIFVAYVPPEVRNFINLPYGTEIKFLGEDVKVRCKRYQFGYYSSHVSMQEMDEFMDLFENTKVILFNHGSNDSKVNYTKRYKTDNNTTHNLLFGETVMITKNGIEKYF